jgi:folate-dependent phosphoribosylglycinamide formyltransferase PurN
MRHVLESLLMAEPHLVLALGWDLILPSFLVGRLDGNGIPIVNLHPALLSANGAPVVTDYGEIPVIKGQVESVMRKVLEQKLPATGATIHLIPPTAEVDQGPVLLREVVQVLPDDTPQHLRVREQVAERLLVRVLISHFQSTGSLPKPID